MRVSCPEPRAFNVPRHHASARDQEGRRAGHGQGHGGPGRGPAAPRPPARVLSHRVPCLGAGASPRAATVSPLRLRSPNRLMPCVDRETRQGDAAGARADRGRAARAGEGRRGQRAEELLHGLPQREVQHRHDLLPGLRLLGQPNTFLAPAPLWRSHSHGTLAL
jgi:hypothetical protein